MTWILESRQAEGNSIGRARVTESCTSSEGFPAKLGRRLGRPWLFGGQGRKNLKTSGTDAPLHRIEKPCPISLGTARSVRPPDCSSRATGLRACATTSGQERITWSHIDSTRASATREVTMAVRHRCIPDSNARSRPARSPIKPPKISGTGCHHYLHLQLPRAQSFCLAMISQLCLTCEVAPPHAAQTECTRAIAKPGMSYRH